VLGAALRRHRPRPGDTWHLDEVFITINTERYSLWRAVDQDGTVLDILVQSRRNKQARSSFSASFLQGCQYGPRVIIRINLRAMGLQKRAILPGVEHRNSVPQQPCRELAPPHRQRERRMQGSKSPGMPNGSRRVWAYRPTLSTTPASLIRACISSRDEGKKPDLG